MSDLIYKAFLLKEGDKLVAIHNSFSQAIAHRNNRNRVKNRDNWAQVPTTIIECEVKEIKIINK